MSHGVRGDFTDYRGQTLIEGRANWRVSVFPTGALPFFEVPERFIAEYDAFLESPPIPATEPGAMTPNSVGVVTP